MKTKTCDTAKIERKTLISTVFRRNTSQNCRQTQFLSSLKIKIVFASIIFRGDIKKWAGLGKKRKNCTESYEILGQNEAKSGAKKRDDICCLCCADIRFDVLCACKPNEPSNACRVKMNGGKKQCCECIIGRR